MRQWTQCRIGGRILLAGAGLLLAGMLSVMQAKADEIFHPMLVTRTGPFATAATAVSSGQQDYFALMNLKGGIDGHTVRWEECEFGYQTPST